MNYWMLAWVPFAVMFFWESKMLHDQIKLTGKSIKQTQEALEGWQRAIENLKNANIEIVKLNDNLNYILSIVKK